MKKIYRKEKSNNTTQNRWQVIAVLFGLLVSANMVSAQTAMKWTGATSNNFLVEENWDPAGSPAGNTLTIPRQTDSTLVPFAVEVAGAQDITVASLTIEGATEDTYQPSLTINLDPGYVFYNTAKINYGFTGIIVKSGTFSFKKTNSPRLDGANTWLKVEGDGKAEFNNLAMGNGKNTGSAGKIYLSGNGQVTLSSAGFFRYENIEGGQVQIIENAKLIIETNFESPFENWINGGENYSINRTYDAISNTTTFTAVPADFIGIANNDRQVLKNGETTADTLRLTETNKVKNATTFQWRYRKDGETSYTNFTATEAKTSSFAPSFESSGTFFVSCLVDGTETKNEVEFFVVSNAISILPKEFDIQFLRLGELGTVMTANFTKSPSQMEWKYSTTPGGPYMSFNPAAKQASFSPSFTDVVGNHYVIVEAMIDGQINISTELLYNVEETSSVGKSLTWTGLNSTDPKDPANWKPVAHYFKNSITIPHQPSTYITNASGDTTDIIESDNYPVFKMMGNDTISKMEIAVGARMDIIPGRAGIVDTINFRSDLYVNGTLNVDNVMIDYTSYFWRLPEGTSRMNMSGDASLSILADYNGGPSNLLMGDPNGTKGGYIDMKDQTKLFIGAFFRMVTTKNDSSVIALADDAQIWFKGDGRANIQTYIDSTKIRCSQQGFEPDMQFDGEWTIISARNVNSFAVDNASRTFTTAGYPIDSEIGLINTDGINGWEWKYSSSINGPWNSFSPAAIDVAKFSPTFAEAGDFYLIAESSDGIKTSNKKKITVIDLSVSPAEAQTVKLNESCKTLNATLALSSEVTLLTGEWIIYDELGNEYTTGISDLTYLPVFSTVGTYEVFFYAEVQDEYSVSYSLFSNKVSIKIEKASAVNDVSNISNLKLFPNPTNCKFYVENSFNDDYTIDVIDLTGSIVYKQNVSAQSNQAINLKNKGVYIVKLTSNNKVKIGRIVVK